MIRYNQIDNDDRQGDGTQFLTSAGPFTSGNVITTDASGKAVDGGATPGAGTVTHTGTLTSGQIIKGNGAADITVGNLAGDVTTSGSMTTTLANIPNDTTMAGDLLATAIAAPATPAAGKGRIYVDSTAKNIAVKDDAGVVKHGVQSKAAVATNFLTAISDAGLVTAAQPTDADLSLSAITTNDVSTTKHGFAPTLPNDATKFLNGVGGYTTPGGSSGGYVLLEQHTASASSTLDFTTWYSSAYDDYIIRFVNILVGTNTADLLMRMSTDGGATYDSGNNYGWALNAWIRSSAGQAGSDTTNVIELANSISTTASYVTTGEINLVAPADAAAFKTVYGMMFARNSANGLPAEGKTVVGVYKITTAVNAFRILPSTGTITSGTVRVYGLAK